MRRCLTVKLLLRLLSLGKRRSMRSACCLRSSHTLPTICHCSEVKRCGREQRRIDRVRWRPEICTAGSRAVQPEAIVGVKASAMRRTPCLRRPRSKISLTTEIGEYHALRGELRIWKSWFAVRWDVGFGLKDLAVPGERAGPDRASTWSSGRRQQSFVIGAKPWRLHDFLDQRTL